MRTDTSMRDTKADRRKNGEKYIYHRDSSDDDIVSIRHPSPRFNGSTSPPVSRLTNDPARTIPRIERQSKYVDRCVESRKSIGTDHGRSVTRSHGSLFTVRESWRRKLIFAIPVIVRVRQVYAGISGREKLAWLPPVQIAVTKVGISVPGIRKVYFLIRERRSVRINSSKFLTMLLPRLFFRYC